MNNTTYSAKSNDIKRQWYIIDASGSDYIINVVKDKQFNKAKILVKYIESYFEDNGGKC